ncbi:DUF4352 domain-containing protein [Streptomonospora litoralis]|uniref:Telomeric repeat-binding factor 2 n=1 Tax=Streptomonospora litoralis TaxID=2498135 RepID=A0A4P6QAK1_9ACTN|nr:DUF4352 domain-containing protein [Streptomonospora litoralis]QBI56781.1 Telomeric repeat-binding factor 2 [Streptomonospora litoralis]
MAYGNYPPPPPVPNQPPSRGGLTTGSKIALGCGIAAIGGFVLMMAGCMALVVASPSGTSPDPGAPPAADNNDEGGGAGDGEESGGSHVVGDTVSHGSWDITVTSVEQGIAQIEDDFGLTEEASGQFVVLEVEAVNTGSEGEYFEPSNQVLMDPGGSMYEYNIGATTGIDSLEKINPGGQVSGRIAYDVPADFELDHILVNGEGAFADGVRVDLKK